VDHLAANGAMVVLRLLDLTSRLIFPGHPPLQAILTRAAKAGEHFDAIQGRHQSALHSALVEDLAALEAAVHLYQHRFQRAQIETAQTVA